MTLLPPHFIEILDYVDMISIMQPLQIFQVQLHAKKSPKGILMDTNPVTGMATL